MNATTLRKALAIALALTPVAGAGSARAAETAAVTVVAPQPQSEADRIYADALAKALTPAQMQAAYQAYLDALFPMPLMGGGGGGSD